MVPSATIAEVDGVAGLSNTMGAELTELLGKKSVSKGIKVSFEDGTVIIDALILVRYGYGVTVGCPQGPGGDFLRRGGYDGTQSIGSMYMSQA
jgi:hypothetical protein